MLAGLANKFVKVEVSFLPVPSSLKNKGEVYRMLPLLLSSPSLFRPPPAQGSNFSYKDVL